MRFSIRGILAITTFVALLLAAFVSPPVVASIAILTLWPFAAAMSLGLAVYGRGWLQAFATGVCVPMVFFGSVCSWTILAVTYDASPATLDSLFDTLDDIALSLKIVLAVTCVTAPLCGALTLAIRAMFREDHKL